MRDVKEQKVNSTSKKRVSNFPVPQLVLKKMSESLSSLVSLFSEPIQRPLRRVLRGFSDSVSPIAYATEQFQNRIEFGLIF